MKGDFSRPTFDPKKGYSGVLLQQGRVLLDSDWNEQGAIVRNRIETETRDVIGGCGGPKAGAGFEVYTWTIIARPQPGPVYDAFEDIPSESKAADVRSSGPATAASGKAGGVNPGPDPGPFFDLRPRITAGRYYVDGILVESEYNGLLVDQPHLPLLPNAKLFDAAGLYLAYLDVWDRHITVLDDPTIRETALGGPDTTARSKTIWQVKVVNVGTGAAFECGSSIPAYDAATAKPTGKMTARTAPAPVNQGPCIVSPGAGYLGLENQLYRVEVHDPSPTDGVVGGSFKWSRDNGTTVTTIEKIDGAKITVHDVGPDSVLGFAQGQWAELTDDVLELNGLPGQLIRIASVDQTTRVITLVSPATALADINFADGVNPARHPKLRRWDGLHPMAAESPDGFIDLEDGLQVQFSSGTYRTGDYWTIPARTATADVASGNIEWPVQADGTTARLPFGIDHHYCRIAMMIVDDFGGVLGIEHCRCLFPALNDIEGFFYVGGDGQEVMPGGVMPQPLQVGVFKVGMSNNCVPVRNALVQFRTPDGGTLGLNADETKGAEATPAYNVATDPNGVATIFWRPNPDLGPHRENISQTVTARLITEDGLQTQTVVFNGQLSIASEVAYNPTPCANLGPNVKTVDDALDAICLKLGSCHDFLDELRSDGVVRRADGRLSCEVSRWIHGTPSDIRQGIAYEAGVAYVNGCRFEIAAGTLEVEQSTVGQWVVVNAGGTVEVLVEPLPPRHCALLAWVATYDGTIIRLEDVRRDLADLDEQVEGNRHGVATAHIDARQYVPWHATSMRDLRYRDEDGVYAYRDGRNRWHMMGTFVTGTVFDGRRVWAAVATSNASGGAEYTVRCVERYAPEAAATDVIAVDRYLHAGAFDGVNVWFTAPNPRPGESGGRLVGIDTVTRERKDVLLDGRPYSIVFDGHYLWAACRDEGTVHQIDVATNRVVRVLRFRPEIQANRVEPLALEFDGEYIWVTINPRELYRIQKPWGEPEEVSIPFDPEEPMPAILTHMVFDGSHLWMRSPGGVLIKLDPLTKASHIVRFKPPTDSTLMRGNQKGGMIFDGTHLWLMPDNDDPANTMFKVDPRTETVLGEFPMPRHAAMLGDLPGQLYAFDGTHLWYPFVPRNMVLQQEVLQQDVLKKEASKAVASNVGGKKRATSKKGAKATISALASGNVAQTTVGAARPIPITDVTAEGATLSASATSLQTMAAGTQPAGTQQFQASDITAQSGAVIASTVQTTAGLQKLLIV